MHGLDAPPLADKFCREPIEQFRIRGSSAILTEVARSAYDAFPEVLLPDSIHHHSSGERILIACDPFGQRKPKARAATDKWNLCGFSFARHTLGETGLHLVGLCVQLAGCQDIGRGQVGHIGRNEIVHSVRNRAEPAHPLIQLLDLILSLAVALPFFRLEDRILTLLEERVRDV
jgi:hypothetical protein